MAGRPHRRRADPEERPAIDLERIDHAVDALDIGLLPAVRADGEPLVADLHLLAVVGAEHADDDVGLLGVEDLGKLLVPVEAVGREPARKRHWSCRSRRASARWRASGRGPRQGRRPAKSPITRILRALGSFGSTVTVSTGVSPGAEGAFFLGAAHGLLPAAAVGCHRPERLEEPECCRAARTGGRRSRRRRCSSTCAGPAATTARSSPRRRSRPG